MGLMNGADEWGWCGAFIGALLRVLRRVREGLVSTGLINVAVAVVCVDRLVC